MFETQSILDLFDIFTAGRQKENLFFRLPLEKIPQSDP